MFTDEQLAQHYREGIKDQCLVCDRTLYGNATNYNGQIRCSVCGTTYQILGCHLQKEWMLRMGLTKDEVAKRYCDCIELVGLFRCYWKETHSKIPWGCYLDLDRSPIVKEDIDSFYDWLNKNSDRFQKEYAQDFNWQAISEYFKTNLEYSI